MTRPQNDAPVLMNPATGEMVDDLTIPLVNAEMVQLNRDLAAMQEPMKALLKEQKDISRRYLVEYSTAVLASKAGAADQRKADALIYLSTLDIDGSGVDLLTRKETLDVRVRAMRDAGHDIRARLSTLQSVANNLRTETNLLRYQT